MIAVIDNFDSFTYNLVQYIGEINPDVQVFRNNSLTVQELWAKKPSHVVISPGPCTPNEAGISIEAIQSAPHDIPILGVCLGHQSIGQAFGGKIIRSPYVMHGKISQILWNESKLFSGLEKEFTATRYHSLMVDKQSFPECLKITGETKDGLIMAIEHREKPIYGIQFHPESILTLPGKQIVQNFLNIEGDENV